MKIVSETVVVVQCETCPETARFSTKSPPWAISRPSVVATFVKYGWTRSGRCPECKGKRKQ